MFVVVGGPLGFPNWCLTLQGASEEAAEAEVAPSEDDPQPLTDADHAERDHLLKVRLLSGMEGCSPWCFPWS